MPLEKPTSLPPTVVRDATAPLPIPVRVGSPRVRPNVAPISGRTGTLNTEDLLTSFIIVWQPTPRPPSLWVRALREAPFGTQLVRASDLRWDGKFLSVELVNESDIDAFAAEMTHGSTTPTCRCSRANGHPQRSSSRRRAGAPRRSRTASEGKRGLLSVLSLGRMAHSLVCEVTRLIALPCRARRDDLMLSAAAIPR